MTEQCAVVHPKCSINRISFLSVFLDLLFLLLIHFTSLGMPVLSSCVKSELPEDCEPKLENHQCLEPERTSQRGKINLKKGKSCPRSHTMMSNTCDIVTPIMLLGI